MSEFEDFVRKSLTSLNDNLKIQFEAVNTKLEDMNNRMEEVIIKQSDIDKRVTDLENNIPHDLDTQMKEFTKSLEYESAQIKDNSTKIIASNTELNSHKLELDTAIKRIE